MYKNVLTVVIIRCKIYFMCFFIFVVYENIFTIKISRATVRTSFSVWETKEENAASGKVGGYDWTSLMRRDKRRLLQVEY